MDDITPPSGAPNPPADQPNVAPSQPSIQSSPTPEIEATTGLPTETLHTAATTGVQAVDEDSTGVMSSVRGFLWSILLSIINWIVVPIVIVFVLHNFVFQAFHVVGSSMAPTLKEADYLIVSKVGNSLAKAQRKAYIPKRGEIVVFRYPKDLSLVFVKRVIGLPGDRVVVRSGKITVYNQATPQGFDPDDSKKYKPSDPVTLGEYDDVIPDGNVFVVGDNRAPNGSYDSREWGTLPSSDIIGDAVLRLLPLDAVKFLARASRPF